MKKQHVPYKHCTLKEVGSYRTEVDFELLTLYGLDMAYFATP